MTDKLTKEQSEEILVALNEAIEKGPWEKSNFLKVLGKNLTEIRDDYVQEMGAIAKIQQKIESQLANRMASRSGQREVFISLYSTEGSKIQAWEKIIANLPRHTVSRPIYSKEEEVKEIIKTKENKQNEAYVAIFINPSDILTLAEDKIAKDKLGSMLLNVKDKTFNLENITRFVHISGLYKWEEGRLLPTNKGS